MGYKKASTKDAWMFWQTGLEDGVPEPAIMIEAFGDVICITCDDNAINVNYDSVDSLCKLLKEVKKNRDSK